MRVVLCAGVFDLLHVGHIRHLKEARTFGDYLVVGLTMDAHVGKKGRPVIPESERMEMLRALRCVSAVALVRDSVEALEKWRPNVYCKGSDYTIKGLLPAELRYCTMNFVKVRHTRHNEPTTSGIIRRIRCAS